MSSAKRRKTAGSNPSANLQARRYAPATAAETISATAPAATTSTAPSASTTTASQQARPDVHSIVWAQCQGHAFWPGRVVAGATASLRVDFFGDNTTYAFKNAACVVPFCHERARQFEQAGRDQLDEDLRAKFVVACAAAAAAQRQLQGEQHSARSATQVRCGLCDDGQSNCVKPVLDWSQFALSDSSHRSCARSSHRLCLCALHRRDAMFWWQQHQHQYQRQRRATALRTKPSVRCWWYAV